MQSVWPRTSRPLVLPESVKRADATQEVDAADVLEVVGLPDEDHDVLEPFQRPDAKVVPTPQNVPTLQLPVVAPTDDATRFRRAQRRRWTVRLVAGSLAVAGALLAGAVGVWLTRAPAPAAPPRLGEANLEARRGPDVPVVPALVEREVGQPKARLDSPPKPAPAATIGVVRVDRAVGSAPVFLDGARLSASSAMVRCGAHDVKVGRTGRIQRVEVPCDGEVIVSR